MVCCFSSFLFFPLYNGLFKKKKNGGCGWGHTFFGKTSEISRYVTLLLAIPDKTRLHSWNFCNVKFQNQKPRPLEFPIFFLITPGNSTSFLTNLWRFCILFLRYPEKFHILNSLLCLFSSWNSPLSEKVHRTNSKHFSPLVTKVKFLKWKAKIAL